MRFSRKPANLHANAGENARPYSRAFLKIIYVATRLKAKDVSIFGKILILPSIFGERLIFQAARANSRIRGFAEKFRGGGPFSAPLVWAGNISGDSQELDKIKHLAELSP